MEERSGGFVIYRLEDGQPLYLLIKSSGDGYWGLPKGKIDDGEKKEEAALREVKEETGLKDVRIEELAGETYHTYRDPKRGRVLKRTFWYRMLTNDHQLIPQTDEDIEEARWVQAGSFLSEELTMYNSIREILKKTIT